MVCEKNMEEEELVTWDCGGWVHLSAAWAGL